jgi:hypothetical protein
VSELPKFTFAFPLRAKSQEKISVCIKFLNSIISSTRDPIVSFFINIKAVRESKFAISLSLVTPFGEESSILVKNLYAVIISIYYVEFIF